MSHGRIHLLPDHVSNRIAAGEIIERPASVVRELLDNAIDAAARRIEISVRGGGLGCIEVRDDGCGIFPDDLLLAFERHATSKIRSADDLDTIATLGFRGEALPSIASVSRLIADSFVREAPTGARVIIDSGTVIEHMEILCDPGTRIQVLDLFRNVPARKKFLKSLNTELGHVAESVIDHAVAFPDVHFSYQCEDRTVIDVGAVSRWSARIQDLFGKTFVEKMIYFEDVVGEISIRGFISDPGSLQATARSQRLFVNQRRIRDRMIVQALYKAYQEFITAHGHPMFIIDIRMPADRIDINVHPAKSEVRFQDSGAMFSVVIASIRKALGGSISHAFSKPAEPVTNPLPSDSSPIGRESMGESFENVVRAGSAEGQLTPPPACQPLPFDRSVITFAPSSREGLFDANQVRADHWEVIGQLMSTFILVDAGEHLLIVDQHTAHERILFEQLKRDYSDGKIPSQGLIFPVPIELEPNLFGILIEFSDLLGHMGVVIDDFGRNSILVRALPRHLSDERVEELLRDIASELLDTGTSDRLRHAERKLLITLSCRRAVKAGDRLDLSEMHRIVERLLRGDIPSTCPHGRPIVIAVPRREIETRFKR